MFSQHDTLAAGVSELNDRAGTAVLGDFTPSAKQVVIAAIVDDHMRWFRPSSLRFQGQGGLLHFVPIFGTSAGVALTIGGGRTPSVRAWLTLGDHVGKGGGRTST